MKRRELLASITLSFILSSSIIGWTFLSIALNQKNASGILRTYTAIHLDILVPAVVYLCFGYLLGSNLNSRSLERVGIPAFLLSFFLTLAFSTPFSTVLPPCSTSAGEEDCLLQLAFITSTSLFFIVGWAVSSKGGIKGRHRKPL
ncbi:hypothetical protein A3L09_10230 [Thermococcus profundus]|uniref:Uncharacterized protein n=1 Tax=Thermococcus profundus TaxID=49899 RepID=A0A2Z2MNX2_THEPR|nr:hypothetical protein [Thermococcus profundus]ASJ03608.1 hypothetical protein A3L09_10230 [Thermococcus profundus]